MKDKVYLVADPYGVLRMTKREPSLNRGEVAVRVTVTVPDGVFKQPIIGVVVDVPEDRVIEPVAEVVVDAIPDAAATQEAGQ